jgi:hypothetical protein
MYGKILNQGKKKGAKAPFIIHEKCVDNDAASITSSAA